MIDAIKKVGEISKQLGQTAIPFLNNIKEEYQSLNKRITIKKQFEVNYSESKIVLNLEILSSNLLNLQKIKMFDLKIEIYYEIDQDIVIKNSRIIFENNAIEPEIKDKELNLKLKELKNLISKSFNISLGKILIVNNRKI